MVELAAKRLGERARVLQGNVKNLRGLFWDEAFDLVLSSLVLHYLDDLSELRSLWNGRAFLDRTERWCFQLIIPYTKQAYSSPDTCEQA